MAAPKSKKRQEWPPVRQTVNNGAKVWLCDARVRKGEIATGDKTVLRRYFFATAVEADAKADLLRVQRENEGSNGTAVPERLRVEAVECSKRLARLGVSLTEAVDYYLAHARPDGGSKTVKELVDEFLLAKQQADRRPEYLRVQRHVMGRFTDAFPERQTHELAAQEIHGWMQAQPWAPRTRLNYHRDLSNLFGFAIRRGYCASNPLKRLEAPTVNETGAPGVLTPAQAEKLLLAAAKEKGDLAPFVAIGLFAGLRTSELLKLDWSKIDLEEKTIAVAPHVSKTREHRYVSISENLLAWLLPSRKDSGPVKPPAWRWHFERARTAAGITPWPDNAMRHSFGTYHYAHHKNAAMAAAEMGHRNDTRSLFSHYRALAKPSEAAKYWALFPCGQSENKSNRLAA